MTDLPSNLTTWTPQARTTRAGPAPGHHGPAPTAAVPTARTKDQPPATRPVPPVGSRSSLDRRGPGRAWCSMSARRPGASSGARARARDAEDAGVTRVCLG